MHVFLYNDAEEGTEVIVKSTNVAVTWWQLTELYFQYLQASGYQLTRKDFAEVIQDNFL